MISIKQQKKIKLILSFLLIGILFGIFMILIIREELNLRSILSGSFWGFIISFFIVIMNLIFSKFLKKLKYGLTILIKGLIYFLFAYTITYFRIRLDNELYPIYVSEDFALKIVLLVTLILSFIISFFSVIHRIPGQNVVSNFITGKYYKPVEKENIYMFIDLVSSTAIAEKIGHIKFQKLMNKLIHDITDSILDSGGEIYKYVGDEIIIVWEVNVGIKNNRCIDLYFDIENQIKKNKEIYQKEYGILPHFRAGVHIGVAIIGEIGDYNREIAFLGDTVNTASRIQSECSSRNKDLLISAKLNQKLNLNLKYKTKSLGFIELKGKKEKVELIEVNKF